MDTKKRNITIIVVSIAVLFVSFYYIRLAKIKGTKVDSNKRQVNSYEKQQDSLAVGGNKGAVLSKGCKLIFKIKYTKSNDELVQKEEQLKDESNLLGKGKEDVENSYKKEGFNVEKFSSNEVILVKKEDKYAPNKYVVGIKDEKIAIYRTDKSGNMYIEDEHKDITDIKTNRLKEQDIEMLTKGDKYFQCNTREEAEARLEDYE